MASTYYFENILLNYLFRARAIDGGELPSNLYFGLGLSTSTPVESGSLAGLIEPSASDYYRVAITRNLSNFTAASSGSLTNTVPIEFLESTTNWGTIKYIFLANTQVKGTGNVLWYSEISPTRSIESNTVLSIPISGLVIYHNASNPL